jgi:hypothetical protein
VIVFVYDIRLFWQVIVGWICFCNIHPILSALAMQAAEVDGKEKCYLPFMYFTFLGSNAPIISGFLRGKRLSFAYFLQSRGVAVFFVAAPRGRCWIAWTVRGGLFCRLFSLGLECF